MNLLHERWWLLPENEVMPAFEAELDNVRAVLEWAAVRHHALAVELMGAAIYLFGLLGLGHEARRRSVQIDALVTGDIDPAIVARYWNCRARHQFGVDHRRMHDTAAKGVALFRRLGDERGLYSALAMLLASGHVPRADSQGLLDEALGLERADWTPKARAHGRAGLGTLHYFERRYADAAAYYDQAKALAMEGSAERLAAIYTALAAMAHYALGNVDEPVRLCQQAVLKQRRLYGVINMPLGSLALDLPLGSLALSLTLQGRLDQAREAFVHLFRAMRASDWHLFDMFNEAYLMLALMEGRHETRCAPARLCRPPARPSSACASSGQRVSARRERHSKACSSRRPWSD